MDDGLAENDFVVGLTYDMKVSLPSFFVRDDKKSDRRNIPMVENVYLDLYYSGTYKVVIKRTGYQDRELTLPVTISDIYFANNTAIDEIASRAVPVYCRGDYAYLDILASEPLPLFSHLLPMGRSLQQ